MKKGMIVCMVATCFLGACNDSSNEGEVLEEVNELISEDFSDILSINTSYNYANPDLPDHFVNGAVRNIDNTPGNNPVTDEGALLGRVLFYDKKLSANNTIACASCHIQANAFSDPNVLSIGFEGGLTGRNSMSLSNARYYDNGRFFWDERAATLEDQALMPIQDPVEMGMDLNELVIKLQQEDYYQHLFENAFGSSQVTSERISQALSQFVRAMVSYQSKYDEGLIAANGQNNQDFNNFTALENQGKRLFFSGRTQCANCHETATFSGDEARNNGLDAITTDRGLGAVTGNTSDDGKFKAPSLRNIALSAPYMHDGRFATLREVIGFYNNGIQNHPNLDNRLRVNNGQVRRMNLSDQEREALVAFLHTLTDESFINEEKFSDPFVN